MKLTRSIFSAGHIAIFAFGPAFAQKAQTPTDLDNCLGLLNELGPRIEAGKLDEKVISEISPKGEAMAAQCMAKDWSGAFKTYGEITATLASAGAKQHRSTTHPNLSVQSWASLAWQGGAMLKSLRSFQIKALALLAVCVLGLSATAVVARSWAPCTSICLWCKPSAECLVAKRPVLWKQPANTTDYLSKLIEQQRLLGAPDEDVKLFLDQLELQFTQHLLR